MLFIIVDVVLTQSYNRYIYDYLMTTHRFIYSGHVLPIKLGTLAMI